MPIILAIEPDRRQAAHLAGIVRQRVGAELILADTTEGALDAIGNRIPDLVLVPALLSPQDDAALAAALRVIAAAAHVRTLTIPVLSSGGGAARSQPGGMLAKWRRGRAEAVPDGCDPAVFAEQINAYLIEAAAERAQLALAPEEDLTAFEPPRSSEPVLREFELAASSELPVLEPIAAAFEAIPETRFEPIVEETPVEEFAAMATDAIAETIDTIEPAAAAWSDTWTPAEAEPALEEAVEPWNAGAFAQPLVDLSDELAYIDEDIVEDAVAEPLEEAVFAGEPFGIYTISSTPEETTLDAFDDDAAIVAAFEDDPADEAVPVVEPVAIHAAVDVELAAFEIEIAAVAATAADQIDGPDVDAGQVVEAEARCLDIESYVPLYLKTRQMWPALEGVPVEPPAAKPEHPEWIELVASLRQDIERRRTEMPAALVRPVAARPAEAVEAKVTRPVKRQNTHASQTKPIQDEWGFFDPEQCGFSALLAKLDEITDVAEDTDRRRPS